MNIGEEQREFTVQPEQLPAPLRREEPVNEPVEQPAHRE